MNVLKTHLKVLALLVTFLILVSAKHRPIQVFMAGDSTMAEKPMTKSNIDTLIGETIEEVFLEKGWGMLLPEYLKEKAIVRNYAKNGRSSRTFIEQGWWDTIISQIQSGDVVIIQFGHNDCAVNKPDRYTNPDEYRKNLIRFVEEVRVKKGIPVICTSIARRKFDGNDKIVNPHGEYPSIAREVAKSKKVALIDMQKITTEWLENEGVENSKQYFHKIPADGSSKLFPEGLDDNTHLNEKGARIVAGFFASEISSQKIKHFYRYIK